MTRQPSQPNDPQARAPRNHLPPKGDSAAVVAESRPGSSSVVPLKDRLFAHLSVVDGYISLSKARRALEKLVLNLFSDEPDARPSARRILVEAGALTAEQASEIRRIREGLLLECWRCYTLYWLEPFDPLYPHRCKRCGDDLAWPSRPPAPSLSDSATRSVETEEERQARDSNASDTGNVAELMRRRDTTSTFRPPTVSQVAREYAESALGERDEHAARLELELIGRRMGSFLVRQLVGRGGMGSVYEAFDPGTEQVAAIKVMMPMAASAVDYVWRFKREAELSSKMRHPNLVEVWEFGELGPWLYLTMPFVEGKTLQQILHERGKPLPVERTVHHIADALDGVHAAHEIGILHRDLKPDNLLVTPEGRVRVLDFGLARAQLDDRITQVGQTVGTPRFMSPEQWRDQSVGPQADVHSLGISLYYLLTGHFPYPDADTPLGAYHSMMDNMPVPLRRYRPEVGAELEAAVHRMMAKDVRRRPAEAREAAEALRNVVPPLDELRDEPLTGANSGTRITELGGDATDKQQRRRTSTHTTTPAASKKQQQRRKQTASGSNRDDARTRNHGNETTKRRDERSTPAVSPGATSGNTTLDHPLRGSAPSPRTRRARPLFARLNRRRQALYALSLAAVVVLAVLLTLIATGTLFGASGGTEPDDEDGTATNNADNDERARVPVAPHALNKQHGREVVSFSTVGPGRVLSLDAGRIRAAGELLVVPEAPLNGRGEHLLRMHQLERQDEVDENVRLGVLRLADVEGHATLPSLSLELVTAPLDEGATVYLLLTLNQEGAFLTQAPTVAELAETPPAATVRRSEGGTTEDDLRVAVKIPEGVTVELTQWRYFPRVAMTQH